MNPITIFIVVVALAAYLIFQGVKNFQLHNLNMSLKRRDSETVEKIADMGMSRRLLGEYVCDLYKLRVYYLTKEVDKFEKVLKHMLKAEKYRPDDRESFLEIYFHTFLIKGNRKYADWILDAIRKTGNEKFIRYNEESYAVMLDKRSDLIDKMEEDINSKLYYGFALGVVLFMVAKQYSYLGDNRNALEYMRSAKACFHPKAVYMPVVDKYLEEAEA
ncbi:hypothetical protein [[Ruminococcus] torques]|uniref:hypothetical protein n=1 Tax=[Ruminococcus] torques TaxID=33039 RepID=UPI0015BD0231|nr:hypothetical protein [[Ruminococcus] torques]MBS5399639.1 hypothetical protein [Lachnospiraceae bacterium]MDM8236822.1 hypothetical protein [[Ruminococcus] torques]HJC81407.1 hypothetical protein [Candidatus Mediterraneibacter excrementipullorum]